MFDFGIFGLIFANIDKYLKHYDVLLKYFCKLLRYLIDLERECALLVDVTHSFNIDWIIDAVLNDLAKDHPFLRIGNRDDNWLNLYFVDLTFSNEHTALKLIKILLHIRKFSTQKLTDHDARNSDVQIVKEIIFVQTQKNTTFDKNYQRWIIDQKWKRAGNRELWCVWLPNWDKTIENKTYNILFNNNNLEEQTEAIKQHIANINKYTENIAKLPYYPIIDNEEYPF